MAGRAGGCEGELQRVGVSGLVNGGALNDAGESTEPVTAAVEAGDLRDVNAQTLGHDLMATAHMWALKHWYFQRIELDLDTYIDRQVRTLVLSNLSETARR